MKAKTLSPKALKPVIPKPEFNPQRARDTQLPPTSDQPISQRKQLAGYKL